MKYKIGYVDDQAQQFAKCERILRNEFEVIGYDIVKGLPLQDLIQQILDSEIQLLMVDYLMVDKQMLAYNGDEVVRDFDKKKHTFPMIILTNHEDQAFPEVDNPNIIYGKDMMNEKNLPKFIDIIRKNIKIYEGYKNARRNRIKELINKGENGGGLSENEKDELLKNQLELKTLDTSSNEVPLQLLSNENLQNLSKTRKEAEDYLKSLLDKNKK
jgi:hypothetical protein